MAKDAKILIADDSAFMRKMLRTLLEGAGYSNITECGDGKEALEKGYDEAVFLNNLNFVAEGSISNIFIIKDSVVFTPSLDTGILKGITRDVVIEIAADFGIKCSENYLKTDDILTADEVFMTNSLMEIIPVREIDGQIFSDRCPGIITADFMRKYREKIDKEQAA